MMIGNMLISLNENEKRIIILLFLIFILLFVLSGAIGNLIKRIMKAQGKKADTYIHDVVITRTIINKRKLFFFGMRKNNRSLLIEAWIPFLIMLLSSITILIYCGVTDNWGMNIFNYESNGVGTLFYVFDWSDESAYTTVFGLKVLASWPPTLNTPHFEVEAIPSYVFFFGMLIGGIWFLVCTQAYIARTHRLFKLVTNVYEKSLENYGGMAKDPKAPETIVSKQASDTENSK